MGIQIVVMVLMNYQSSARIQHVGLLNLPASLLAGVFLLLGLAIPISIVGIKTTLTSIPTAVSTTSQRFIFASKKFLRGVFVLLAHSECNENEFVCGDKHCVQIDYVCDGDTDCQDGSDEKSCRDLCDDQTQVYCQADATCLPLTKICDGHPDCSDKSDEAKCRNNQDWTNMNNHHPQYTLKTICEENEFTCESNNECIRKEFVCDGQRDCFDNSDENNCTGNVVENFES